MTALDSGRETAAGVGEGVGVQLLEELLGLFLEVAAAGVRGEDPQPPQSFGAGSALRPAAGACSPARLASLQLR
ncbi:MAG: hypothetical protein ACRDQA_23900 [Nocardioidaceae bacterium]